MSLSSPLSFQIDKDEWCPFYRWENAAQKSDFPRSLSHWLNRDRGPRLFSTGECCVPRFLVHTLTCCNACPDSAGLGRAWESAFPRCCCCQTRTVSGKVLNLTAFEESPILRDAVLWSVSEQPGGDLGTNYKTSAWWSMKMVPFILAFSTPLHWPSAVASTTCLLPEHSGGKGFHPVLSGAEGDAERGQECPGAAQQKVMANRLRLHSLPFK